MKRFLYTLIYFLLANSLYVAFSHMYSNAVDSSVDGSNPYIEIGFVAVCIFFCAIANKGIKSLNTSTGFWLVSFLVYILIISVVHGFQFGLERKVAIFIYMQPLLLFYVELIAQQDDNIRKLTPYYVFLLACWIIYLFIINYRNVNSYSMESFHTTNSSYYLLYLMPMLFLNIREKYRFYIFLLVMVVVMISSKRGGLLALGISFLAYYITMDKISGKKHFFQFLFITILLYIVVNMVNTAMDGRILDRFESVSEDGGSGRIDTWLYVWSVIKDSDFYRMLFGNGFNTVINLSGTDYSAHNDFLEIIYDFGWVGFMLFIAFLISFLGTLRKLIKESSYLAPILAVGLSIFIINCFFSHIVIYTECFKLFTLFFGSVCGTEKRIISQV